MAKLKSKTKSKPAAKGAGKSSVNLQAKAEGLSKSIMESAQQIWLAGMGAFGRAQEEGTKLFETLVKEGQNLEKHTRKIATGKVDEVRGKVEKNVGQVRERASDTWDRLEKVFEERVQRALNRLGVPSREDLQGLSKRVDQLNAELRKLSAKPAAPAKPKSVKKVAPAKAAKPAAKKAKPAAAPAAPIQDATE
ncbi:phasin family protein [Pseudomarimonas salicorniae]|uniref:Phasin family protein n=1 Tax=Pseudomarimonas salicorniae TaxID=2933270 RepID=A0ABT0GJN3_9GAMM|nr:phasin family protein [Lysobacter sp. CAU 1642]MCK7594745.1 phasin family protein [Lysobacter sp. CAU 1642]